MTAPSLSLQPRDKATMLVVNTIGESLFTLFASLTYAYHYLMTLTK